MLEGALIAMLIILALAVRRAWRRMRADIDRGKIGW